MSGARAAIVLESACGRYSEGPNKQTDNSTQEATIIPAFSILSILPTSQPSPRTPQFHTPFPHSFDPTSGCVCSFNLSLRLSRIKWTERDQRRMTSPYRPQLAAERFCPGVLSGNALPPKPSVQSTAVLRCTSARHTRLARCQAALRGCSWVVNHHAPISPKKENKDAHRKQDTSHLGLACAQLVPGSILIVLWTNGG